MSYKFADSLLCVQWKTPDDGQRKSETCRVLFQKWIWEISGSTWLL